MEPHLLILAAPIRKQRGKLLPVCRIADGGQLRRPGLGRINARQAAYQKCGGSDAQQQRRHPGQ